jgi:YfiR/HmsC-like
MHHAILDGSEGKLKSKSAARSGEKANAPASESRTGRRRLGLWKLPVVSSLVLILFAGAARAAQDNPSEYQLKAAFVFNFAKFVDWPANTYSRPQSPFTICILGADPFGPAMDDALRGKTIANHPVVVERIKDAVAARHCQIVFVSASEKRRLRDILKSLKGANVLIVGDVGGFAAAGGTIELTLQDNRVRFEINTGAADGAGLRISSKLLALATIVHGAPESGKN